MPEARESRAHYLTAKLSLQYYASSPKNLTGIYADHTLAEEWSIPSKQRGFIFQLNPDCHLRRGPAKQEFDLLCPDPQCRGSKKPRFSITSLSINDVYRSARALQVHLGPIWLKVSLYTIITFFQPLTKMPASVFNPHLHPVLLSPTMDEPSKDS